MKLACAIVDDEPLAREGLADYVRDIDFLVLKGMARDPMELQALLEDNPVDLIFLDIQMPFISGIDFLKMAKNLPMVVLTTAYPHYALEGFRLDVLDYLVKPITFERFFKAASKAKEYHQLRHVAGVNKNSMPPADYFFVKCEHKFEKVYFEDIFYIQACQNYVIIHTAKDKHMVLLPLKSVEQYLENRDFVKVHKSFIVPVSKIDSIENNHVIIRSDKIPISRNYREALMDEAILKRLWKKE